MLPVSKRKFYMAHHGRVQNTVRQNYFQIDRNFYNNWTSLNYSTYTVTYLITLYRVIHKSVKHFKNSQQIDYATDHGNSYADRERNSPRFFLQISQMLNVSTFGNMADIYGIVHLVPHACQHITVDGHTTYYFLLAANQGNYVRKLFL
jgi:hypothetical protein